MELQARLDADRGCHGFEMLNGYFVTCLIMYAYDLLLLSTKKGRVAKAVEHIPRLL